VTPVTLRLLAPDRALVGRQALGVGAGLDEVGEAGCESAEHVELLSLGELTRGLRDEQSDYTHHVTDKTLTSVI
jgi:hypothetical protein